MIWALLSPGSAGRDVLVETNMPDKLLPSSSENVP